MDAELQDYQVVAQKPGEANTLTIAPLPPLSPPDGYLLVKVAAAGVNYIDTYLRSGTYKATFPFTLGSEGSGTVLELGDGVSAFRTGDRVMWNSAPGSYATHVLVPAANAFPVPPEIDLIQAAAIPLQGLTAHYLATDSYQLKPDDIALIHAGAGGVGLVLTQIAKALGAYVITTVSTAEKAEISRLAGADAVIRYDSFDTLASQLPAAVKQQATRIRGAVEKIDCIRQNRGDGVDVVYDGVGAATFMASLKSLRTRGSLVLFGGSSGQVPPFDLQLLNEHGSLTVTRPSLGHFLLTRGELEQRYHQILSWKQQGKLSSRIGQTYALTNAAQAHQALESRATTGKILLVP